MGLEHIINSTTNALAETAEKFNEDLADWAKEAINVKKGLKADDELLALNNRLANSWSMILESKFATRYEGLSAGEIVEMVAVDGELIAKRLRIGGNIIMVLETGQEIYDAIKDNNNPNATIADLITEGVALVVGYAVGTTLVLLIGESLLTVAAIVSAEIFLDDVLHALDGKIKSHYKWE